MQDSSCMPPQSCPGRTHHARIPRQRPKQGRHGLGRSLLSLDRRSFLISLGRLADEHLEDAYLAYGSSATMPGMWLRAAISLCLLGSILGFQAPSSFHPVSASQRHFGLKKICPWSLAQTPKERRMRLGIPRISCVAVSTYFE